MSASDVAPSVSSTVAEVLAKLGTDPIDSRFDVDPETR